MQSKQELAKDSPATQHTWVRAAVAGGQTHNLYEPPSTPQSLPQSRTQKCGTQGLSLPCEDSSETELTI